MVKSKEIYDNYIIYSDGRLYSKKRKSFMSTKTDSWGYVQNILYIDGKPKHKKRHILVAEAFILNPNPDKFDQINHIDGNKTNNDISNLEWCDCYLNNKHARDNGLNKISESNKKRMKENPELKEKILNNLKEHWYEDKSGDKNPNYRKDILYKNKYYSSQEFANLFNLSIKTVYIQKQKYRKGQPVKLWIDNNISVKDLK